MRTKEKIYTYKHVPSGIAEIISFKQSGYLLTNIDFNIPRVNTVNYGKQMLCFSTLVVQYVVKAEQ